MSIKILIPLAQVNTYLSDCHGVPCSCTSPCDWLHESHRIQENWNELNNLLVGREGRNQGGIPIKGLSAFGKLIKMQRDPVDAFSYL